MTDTLAAPTDAVRADAACAHCGLPVGAFPIRAQAGDELFCCVGCSVVYGALHASGLEGTFYALREVDPEASRRPASLPTAATLDLDDPAFRSAHTREVGQGVHLADLFVDGVHCAACVWLVERMPHVIDGVFEARLDLGRGSLSLTFAPDASLQDAQAWLGQFGYALQAQRSGAQSGATAAERALLIKMGVCWALAGNVMLLAFAFYSGLDQAADATWMASAARWLSLALAIPSVVYGASGFFRRAWASMGQAWAARNPLHLHIDTPIALGVAAGFGHSAWVTATGGTAVWFDSITVLIAALLTARWLQLRSLRLASDASARLLDLLPQSADRLTADGSAERVPVGDLQVGDRVVVAPHAVVPADGIVESGQTRLDNAILTGESRPVPVGPGDAVAAGATNLTAECIVRVATAGDASRVGRLLGWVRDRDAARAPVVQLADRLGGVFVLSVLALSVGMVAWMLATGAPDPATRVAALLVITCPCALGMSVPLAVAVASGRAARAGIFVKGGAALQALTQVDAVVLDKTGTLTEGKPRIARQTLLAADLGVHPLDLAAAVEATSPHPIAQALLAHRRAVASQTFVATQVEAVAGQGLSGQVDGRRVVVGRPSWVAADLAQGADRLLEEADRCVADGLTPVAVSVDGQAACVFGLGDVLRPDAHAFVAQMQAEGRAVYLLSGDHPDLVAAVASELGVAAEHAQGDVTPERKLAFVEALQAQGRTVAMIGDGVNDAGAIQQANVGIAVAGGATPSKVAADAFLTDGGLNVVETLFSGAHGVMRRIRLTLATSLGYNLVGAALAVAGLVTPFVAAVLMPVSSLTVVALALTQRTFRARPIPSAR
jgi:Cu2+-exporting ATPase